uniref:Prokaryotic-type class I peptide chain release factors domain-containing protein n=1 Tax=Clastoptera arizonana TaxID=38151 RepID=A0A1B6CSW7_9HEMI
MNNTLLLLHRSTSNQFTLRTLVCSFTDLVKKKDLDYSRVPVLVQSDLEEKFVRGNGPGGQAVAKTNNCVILHHKPSGLVVKCHQTRSTDQNRKIARELLITKLDNDINKEYSIEAQIKAIENNKTKKRDSKRKRLNEMKERWKESEEIT